MGPRQNPQRGRTLLSLAQASQPPLSSSIFSASASLPVLTCRAEGTIRTARDSSFSSCRCCGSHSPYCRHTWSVLRPSLGKCRHFKLHWLTRVAAIGGPLAL